MRRASGSHGGGHWIITEDELNWLWADTIIRQQTHGQKALDDFCRIFHGPPSGPPQVKTYTFEDILSTLNQVAPYDWRGFWTERLGNHGPGAPLGGSGERLETGLRRRPVGDGERPRRRKRDHECRLFDRTVAERGWIVTDTVEGMLAAQAGIGPGMKVIAVNGRKFSANILREALRKGKDSSDPLELLVENTEYYKTFKLDYHGGEKYPHLVRDEAKPDMLSDIIKPRWRNGGRQKGPPTSNSFLGHSCE